MSVAGAALYAYVFLAFLLGGALKGIVGVGMPLVGISLLSLVLDPRLVLALLAVPILVTNLWQAFTAGMPWQHVVRFWPLILFFGIGTWAGAQIIVQINTALLLGILGSIVVVFCTLSLLNPRFFLPPNHERWAGPAMGMGAGILNGISTVNGPPLAMYLVALRLEKNAFIAAYGLICLCGAVPLVVSFAAVGILGMQEFKWSLLALIPIMVGLWIGQWLRSYINPLLFRKVLMVVLILLGINLIRRALMGQG